MIVSTFNIKNDYDIYKSDKSKAIYNYLIQNKIDVLGLQELFSRCDKDLLKLLKEKYNIKGKYRFLSKILLRKSNERTPLITHYKIISSKTYHLPHFPSGLKRVITNIKIKHNDRIISIYNTHLEARLNKVKEKQLKKIYKIISKDKYPIILMGDFNLKIDNPIFDNFIKSLEKLGINKIVNSEKTLKTSKYNTEIDHIFISNTFRLVSKKVVKDLNISDHYPVMIEIKED